MSNESKTMSKYQLKKLIKELEGYRGRNTELVSLYIPAGYDMSKISDFVTSEASEAENIKSKQTRKNVQAALDKLGRKVSEEHETPENGVALFAGNVSDTEGRPDIQSWEIHPPQPIESRRYRCDKEFVLQPLKDMIVDDRVYGLIVMDKNDAAVGYLQGNSIKTVYSMSSEVPGKTRAGGQCLDPDTLVQLSNGNLKKIRNIEIGDEVKAADFESMTLKDSVVKDKWVENKQVYRIETKSPKHTIIASGDHEVFTTDRGIQRASVEDLIEGEKLIFPEKIETSSKDRLIPVEKYYNSYRISKSGQKKLKELRKNAEVSQKKLGQELGRTQTAVSKIELGERDITRDFLQDTCEYLGIEFEEFLRNYCEGKNFSLPKTLDYEIAQIIGYFAGDGSFDPERLNFHEQDQDVAKHYQKLLKKKFDCNTSIRFRENKNYYNLRAFGKPLVRLLKNEFPEIKKAHSSSIPSKILEANNEILAGFIRGFYDAEGHCSEHRGRVGISANNKMFMHQLQAAMIRLEIVSSLTTYDNNKNPYSDRTRYTASISGQKSLQNFQKHIEFTAKRKKEELEKIVSLNKTRSNNRQVIKAGGKVRRVIEAHGLCMEDFKSTNSYLQGNRNISKKAFRKNLVDNSDGELKEKLSHVLKPELLPTEIKSIEKLEEQKVFDISVEAGNFIANNLIVHNSAQRFERIRKQMLKTFLNEIADNSKNAFLEKSREGKLLGVLVGGPGFVKDKFMDDYIHQELKEKVVAVESLNYSGEEALEELVNKAEESIEDATVVKEKRLMNKFFDHLRDENGKSEYGLKQVMKAMEMGAVDTVLISEDFNHYMAEYICPQGHEKKVFEERAKIDSSVKCDECNEDMDLEELSDIVDVMEEKAEQMGSEMELISSDHEEGQRLLNMGGIAAILRYRIR